MSVLQVFAGINAQPREDNLFVWDALMFGPEGSELEYGTFRLRLTFPINYPFRPPIVVSRTIALLAEF